MFDALACPNFIYFFLFVLLVLLVLLVFLALHLFYVLLFYTCSTLVLHLFNVWWFHVWSRTYLLYLDNR